MSNARFSILQARAVKDKKISDSQFRTLAALGMYSDEDGWCFPSLTTLGKDLGKSKQAVGRDTIALRKLGYLEVTARYDKNGSRRSSLYRLKFDLPRQPDVDTPSTPDVDTPSTPDVDVNDPHNDPHNITKNKKNKLDIPEIIKAGNKTMDALLGFAGNAEKSIHATKFFEEALGFGALPWDSKPVWRKFQRWVTEFSDDLGIFKDYANWRRAEGQYKGAMTNTAIRRDPQIFMDTGWPNYLAYTSMSKKPATLQNVRTL